MLDRRQFLAALPTAGLAAAAPRLLAQLATVPGTLPPAQLADSAASPIQRTLEGAARQAQKASNGRELAGAILWQ